MKKGDLVLSKRFNAMGIVVEIFDDLGKENPWIRVLFTNPTETYQWCKLQGLTLVVEEKKDKDPTSGSL
tara:strand:- start:558 stop:764 length:207 start_codon:yes stop_codon:yes gene_type:complete